MTIFGTRLSISFLAIEVVMKNALLLMHAFRKPLFRLAIAMRNNLNKCSLQDLKEIAAPRNILKLMIDVVIIVYAASLSILRPLFSQQRQKCSFRANAVIIGNGPSLKNDMYNILKKRNESIVFCLNYFATNKIFWEIKPEYYVICDPMFWREDANDAIKEDNKLLFDVLARVDWKLTLICPDKGYKTISEKINSSKTIKVVAISNRAYKFNNARLNIAALRLRLCSPYFINVMVVALWCAIVYSFEKIEIYGADFSSFREFNVDQQTNTISSEFSHFYKNSSAQLKANVKYKNAPPKMMHVRLLQAHQAFYQMYLLSSLAKTCNIKIINRSSFSYLDCFDRS